MTQILRPSTETTNDGYLYDPVQHPSSVNITPAGANFPYTKTGTPIDFTQIVDPWVAPSIPLKTGAAPGTVFDQQTAPPDVDTSATALVNIQRPTLIERYHTGYKSISAPADTHGVITKTVTYGGFGVKTDGWTTGVLTTICGINVLDILKTNDTKPTILAEYSKDDGSTWTTIFSVGWNPTSRLVSGGIYWSDIEQTLGPGTTVKQGTGLRTLTNGVNTAAGIGILPSWWGISAGNEFATTISGITDTTKIKVRFTISGGYVIPVGYPYTANGAPYHVGSGLLLADINLTDPNYVAPPPTPTGATGTTGSVPLNAAVIKTGPGAVGQTDTKWTAAKMTGEVVTGTWEPVYLVSPYSGWATISGSNWIRVKEMPTNTTRYRYKTTFNLPANFNSASLDLAMYVDDSAARIALNGTVIGTQPDTFGSAQNNWTAPPHHYSATSGFVAGTNTLEIDVRYQSGGAANGIDILGQVDYTVTTATGSGGGGGGITTNDYDTQIVSIGGTPPYTYSIVNDSQTTLPLTACSIYNTDRLRVNGSGVPSGLYSIHLRVTDSVGGIDDQVVTVRIHDNSKFNILNESIALAPSSFPHSGSVLLEQYGGSGNVTWSLQTGTTLPGAVIDGSLLKFTINNYGSYQVSLSATDALGKTASKIVGVLFTTQSAYKLVDGQIELQYVDSTNVKSGSHQFSFGLGDSHNNSTSRIFNFLLNQAPSPIASKQYAVNKYWSTSDNTTYNLPISGSQSGVVLGSASPITLTNGLVLSSDGTAKMAKIQGKPSSGTNALAEVSIPLIRAGITIGRVHRSYMVVPYAGSSLDNLGSNTVMTVPAIVGGFFTLNPQKPYFNSPDNSRDITWKARVREGSALPKGISLDKNTGLLYGPVVDATPVPPGVIEFVDSQGNVRGTFSVNFNLLAGDFSLIENLPTGKLGSAYSGEVHSSSTQPLTAGSVIYGALPAGLSITTSGNGLVVSGTPTEAGYFDFWIKATNSVGKIGYIYKRLEVGFVTPLAIVTTSLPAVLTGVAYSAQMAAVGGTGSYTWTKTGSFPTSITMNSAGLISGTTADSSYSQLIHFTVTDTAGATASVDIPLAINNTLSILTTSPLPNVTRNLPYSYTLRGQGGTGTGYVWTLDGSSPALPSGLTLGTNGVISGTTAASPTSINLVVKLTDSSTASVTKLLNLTVLAASPTLGIGQAGIGTIRRGCPYQGTLSVTGTGTAPFSWRVSPTSTNPLPAGLQLTANGADQGATAYISGATTADLSNTQVKVELTDASGALVNGYVSLTSEASVQILTTDLPQGKVNQNYSVTLSGQSCNTPYTWSLDGTSPALPSGFSLNSSGFLTGNTANPYSQNIKVRLTDNIGDYTIQTFNLRIVSSDLQITTTEIPEIPAGQPWSFALAATGGTGIGYTWSCADPVGGGAPATGWQVDVSASGTWGGIIPWASGSYTVTASGGSGNYSGTGTFSWNNKNVILAPDGTTSLRVVDPVYYGAPISINVTDITRGQTISGNLNIPFSTSPGDTFPKTITWTQTIRTSASLAAVLPTNVNLSAGGVLSTAGTTAIFDKDVLFTVTDSAGAVATKVLRVKVAVQIVIPVGTLTTGIDKANGTQTGYLGAVGTYPGDIAAISPRPNKSFYVYGNMAGAVASQLSVAVTTNSGSGYYSNIEGLVESVDSSGNVTIKLVFHRGQEIKLVFHRGQEILGGPNPMTNGAPTSQNNAVDVLLTNAANSLTARGTFFFDTVDYGVLDIKQGNQATLPTFYISPDIMN